MKRIAILFAICFMIFPDSKAQRGFHIGVISAFNTSWILNQNNYETLFDCPDPLIQRSEMAYELTFGYHTGVSTGYNFSDNHGLQMDLLYTQAGQNYEDQYTSVLCPEFSNVRREIDLTYFQIPLMYHYSNGPSNGWTKWFISVGPQLSFSLKAEERVWINNVEKTDFQVVEDEKFKQFDFGLAFSAGLNIYLKQDFFVSAAIVSYGSIVDINGKGVQDFISNNDVKYQQSRNAKAGIQVGIHYFYANYRQRASW